MAEVKKVETSIIPVMIGTAGHVDHGKTSLVSLLTGCDTDRLKEEKERGLSIDLGFAPCRFPGGRIAGIIDVPGHEDFIRNMVAGAASIDILMLVVAADDGVMPQTIEHLKVVSLLRSVEILVVITKADLVDNDMLQLVSDDITDLLAGTGFCDITVKTCSNKTMKGIKEVRETLQDMIDKAVRPTDHRAFRMNIERSFTAKGYGTVMTGIPISGCARQGEDTLEFCGEQCTIRAVQSYKIEAGIAVAGACAAINLREHTAKKPKRGMTVHAPGAYSPTKGILVSLKNVHESFSFSKTAKIRFHCGTFSTGASVKILFDSGLLPKKQAFAHIKLDDECILASGDRYIIRGGSPHTTIGGGVILSTRNYRIKQKTPGFHERMELALNEAENGNYFLSELLAGPETILHKNELTAVSHMFMPDALEEVKRLVEEETLLSLGGNSWMVSYRNGEAAVIVKLRLEKYHAANPYNWGMEPGAVCEMFSLEVQAFSALSKAIKKTGGIKILNGRLALEDFNPPLSKKQLEMREKVLEITHKAGVQPPAKGNLKKEVGATDADLKMIIRMLSDEGLVKPLDNYVIDMETYNKCRDKLLELLKEKEVVGISDWREATGAARNFAVALLDHYDACGLTRRTEEGRVLNQ